jgi:dipeptidyl aminopeptidase/acylaminoacyl peptidase
LIDAAANATLHDSWVGSVTMPGKRLGLTAFAAALVFCLAGAPSAAAPLAAYGQLPSIETAALSANGAMLAMVATDGERRMLTVRKVGESKNVLSVMAGQAKVRDLRWVGADHLLVSISVTASLPDVMVRRSEWVEVLDLNLKARTQTNLLGTVQDSIRAAITTPQIRFIGGQPIAFLQAFHFVDNTGRVSLYRVNLANGLIQLVAVGKPETNGWLVGRDGQPLAESRYDAKASRHDLLVRSGAGWRVVDSGANAFGDGSILGLGRDGRAVMLDEAGGNDASTVRELAPGAADWGAPVPVKDNQELIFDPTDERLIGAHALIGDTDAYSFFAPADQAMWDAAAKVFPGDRVTFVSLSGDHAKVLVRVDSPTDGQSFAVVDAVTHAVTPVGPAYAKLTAADLSPVRPVAF